jgi:hypothetical protein
MLLVGFAVATLMTDDVSRALGVPPHVFATYAGSIQLAPELALALPG